MNKRGVTLIELVIAMAITVILIGAISSAFFPITSMFKSQNHQSEVKDIANQVILVLKEEIRDAKEVLIDTTSNAGYVCYYSSDEGKIESNDIGNPKINYMPNGLLKDDYKIDLSFGSSGKAVKIIVKIKDYNSNNIIGDYSVFASPLNVDAVFSQPGTNALCIKKPGA